MRARSCRVVRAALAVLAPFLALAPLGCGRSTQGTAPAADVAPAANSPAGAVERFDWALTRQDVDMVAGLVADDLRWLSAGTDSAGSPSMQPPHDRAWLLAALGSLLHGVPGRHAPSTVTLAPDPSLPSMETFPDSRPGKEPRVHQEVRIGLEVSVRDGDTGETFDVTGGWVFFAARGDSAAIPPELAARGVKPDSTAWWFDRFEDEAIVSSPLAFRSPRPAAADPARRVSFTSILELYYSRLLP